MRLSDARLVVEALRELSRIIPEDTDLLRQASADTKTDFRIREILLGVIDVREGRPISKLPDLYLVVQNFKKVQMVITNNKIASRNKVVKHSRSYQVQVNDGYCKDCRVIRLSSENTDGVCDRCKFDPKTVHI